MLRVLLFLLLSLSLTAAELPDKVDFNEHIRPILSDRCYKCHGPDGGEFGELWEAGLRLDIEEGAKANLAEVKLKVKNAKRKKEGKELSTKLGKAKYAIVPGKPDQSSVIERIFTDDEDDIMPPSDSNLHLSGHEKKLIKKWIEQGAEWGKHWSFVAPVKKALPELKNKSWAKNEIDYFVLRKLESKNIKPSPESAKLEWLRRVYLDIAGVPPTPQEADAFLKDNSSNDYEKVADKLLNSTHYAERMALEWLDNARYADTNGYQYDTARVMWPWRDWVIQAFKHNMPYDEFVKKQLAGDLLPEATMMDKIATGFNRNHGITIEGGIISEEYRIQYVNDRVNTVGTLFLGLTMDCTRCHNHKYDQLTQKDYYSLSALFDKIPEGGRGQNPTLRYTFYDPKQVKQMETQLASLLKQPLSGDDLAKFEEWKKKINTSSNYLHFKKVTSTGGVKVEAADDYSYRFIGENPDQVTYTFTADVNAKQIKSIILEALPDPSMVKNGPGRASNGNAVMSGIQVFTSPVGNPNKKTRLKLTQAVADYSQKGFPVAGLVKKKSTGWAIDGHIKHDKRTAVFELQKAITANQNVTLTVKVDFKSPHAKHSFGRMRLNVSDQKSKQALVNLQLIDKIKAGKANGSKVKELYLKNYAKGGTLGKQITQLESKLSAEKKKAISVMVMQEKPGVRKTHILDRGEYNLKKEEVSANTPEALLSFDGFPKNRLGFSQWLADAKNPLFSRVTVNRIWQMMFGYGLVKTTEDFGAQGEEASHPELLDWLAVDFRENGWDMHKLIKKMVLSATYRQSSKPRNELEDPENRLLAHGPRFRLQGELIRDQALYIAGHLSDKTGGPSVYPYQPAGLWMELTNRPNFQMKYKQSSGDGLYRKSLYTFWKRALPNPSMTAFDAPERDICVVKRARTNTPLQALTLLHDPTYVESSRIMADSILRQNPNLTISENIENLFRKVLVRRPSSTEMKILLSVYEKKLKIFNNDLQLVKSQLSVGEYKHSPGLDEVKLAAFSSVCHTMLNLSETITRN